MFISCYTVRLIEFLPFLIVLYVLYVQITTINNIQKRKTMRRSLCVCKIYLCFSVYAMFFIYTNIFNQQLCDVYRVT